MMRTESISTLLEIPETMKTVNHMHAGTYIDLAIDLSPFK
jgi:hypothetical protein